MVLDVVFVLALVLTWSPFAASLYAVSHRWAFSAAVVMFAEFMFMLYVCAIIAAFLTPFVMLSRAQPRTALTFRVRT
ncbi:MAG TPA: hypothetical protein VHZ04_00910 [Candidatus Paceibacterota bacterium]|jgi:hypothetical protein|nr:hypothetical protein [Candidatus Paceibacterota bacterium]